MSTIAFSEAIDAALAQAMAEDERIVLIGEDVHSIHLELYVRFGERRVRPTPISEAAFVGAAVGAAMAGLRPVVEVMLVDFVTVAADALVNHAAKIEAMSGGRWPVPLVVRATCGGGYGDGGQHEQSLWGWLAHIPELAVVVPSNPLDAGSLMLGALAYGRPVVFLEHKMLSKRWLDFLGGGGRVTVHFEVPKAGAEARGPRRWKPLEPGKAAVLREGKDLTIVSVGLGVHQALQAAAALAEQGVAAGVVDLRCVRPLDRETVCRQLQHIGRLLVVDEDYKEFGLSGELAATALEAGLAVRFARVCTEETIPYARALEAQTLPSAERIMAAAEKLLS
ncbi:MAG: transketolase C-terminal domain-containing protein [bacterium]|jgi:pyruvate dehydrogenase E1 component beta subunit|nr:pyruvate dehydrogenase [candidate division KSB1 bacterium]MDH7560525.1 transketolase C-terminal domain-containing protein [bacterium]